VEGQDSPEIMLVHRNMYWYCADKSLVRPD